MRLGSARRDEEIGASASVLYVLPLEFLRPA
jgi:hypothetical protein